MDQQTFTEAQEILAERFGRDSLIALATLDGDRPSVRTVDGYYENGAFYTVTYAASDKMKQIGKNPVVGVCGEWFTGHGIGENLGHVRAELNAEIAAKLRAAFSAWYTSGHVDEQDPNTIILRIRLTDAVLMNNGTRYELDFTQMQEDPNLEA